MLTLLELELLLLLLEEIPTFPFTPLVSTLAVNSHFRDSSKDEESVAASAEA